MFCPKCHAYLNERDYIKSNMISTSDGVTIEYDARCPNCSVMMGRVVWGHLTIDPELRAKALAELQMLSGEEAEGPQTGPPDSGPPETEPAPAEQPRTEPIPAGISGPRRTLLDDLLADIKPIVNDPAPKRCPHCGMELPPGF